MRHAISQSLAGMEPLQNKGHPHLRWSKPQLSRRHLTSPNKFKAHDQLALDMGTCPHLACR